MFRNAQSFNQPIEGWNTSNITSSAFMFQGAVAFNQPLQNWNVANIRDMREMFNAARSFHQNLDRWSVPTSVRMTQMFEGSGFDVAQRNGVLYDGLKGHNYPRWFRVLGAAHPDARPPYAR